LKVTPDPKWWLEVSYKLVFVYSQTQTRLVFRLEGGIFPKARKLKGEVSDVRHNSHEPQTKTNERSEPPEQESANEYPPITIVSCCNQPARDSKPHKQAHLLSERLTAT
jgi:hypothetical protein